LDALFVAIPWVVALVSADRVLDLGVSTILSRAWIPFVLLFVAFHVMYDIFFLPALGETPGLSLLRMRLAGNGRLTIGKAVLYSLVSFISLAAVGAGFVWAVFDPDRRSWPELAAGGRLAFKDV